MSELFIVVGLRAKAGQESNLSRDLAAVVEPSRQEEGNVRYELFVDRDDPGLFVFVEHWASEEARNRHHNESSHIQNFHANGIRNVDMTVFAHMLKRLA